MTSRIFTEPLRDPERDRRHAQELVERKRRREAATAKAVATRRAGRELEEAALAGDVGGVRAALADGVTPGKFLKAFRLALWGGQENVAHYLFDVDPESVRAGAVQSVSADYGIHYPHTTTHLQAFYARALNLSHKRLEDWLHDLFFWDDKAVSEALGLRKTSKKYSATMRDYRFPESRLAAEFERRVLARLVHATSRSLNNGEATTLEALLRRAPGHHSARDEFEARPLDALLHLGLVDPAGSYYRPGVKLDAITRETARRVLRLRGENEAAPA